MAWNLILAGKLSSGETPMAEKMCGSCMSPLCGTVSGLLVLVAGAAMLLSALSTLNSATSMLIAGAALALYGLGAVVHTANMCPMCK